MSPRFTSRPLGGAERDFKAVMRMADFLEKARVLMEALPYIKEYYGKTVVIKYGGSAMQDPDLREIIVSDIVLMKYVGINPVIVHGGGPEISKYMQAMGRKVEFVDGLRVTDKATMDIVKMVLVGKINKEIVALINQHSALPVSNNRQAMLAVGVSGDDGGLLLARKKLVDGRDIGFVGEVIAVNTKIIEDLIKEDFIPVVASVAAGEDGASYNINADQVAGRIAAALKADKLIFLTDVDGIYEDYASQKGLISELTLTECAEIFEKREVGEGMVPKIEGCIIALKNGVRRAHILNGTKPHALLLEIFTDRGIGTMILP